METCAIATPAINEAYKALRTRAVAAAAAGASWAEGDALLLRESTVGDGNPGNVGDVVSDPKQLITQSVLGVEFHHRAGARAWCSRQQHVIPFVVCRHGHVRRCCVSETHSAFSYLRMQCRALISNSFVVVTISPSYCSVPPPWCGSLPSRRILAGECCKDYTICAPQCSSSRSSPLLRLF